jgi:uncharacterized protein (DUF924 family)
MTNLPTTDLSTTNIPQDHNRHERRAAKHYLTAAQVKERYGNRSDMWLTRKLRHDPKFPRPMMSGRMRLYDSDEIDAYDAELKAARDCKITESA